MSTWSFSSVTSLTIRFCVCIALSKGVAVRDLRPLPSTGAAVSKRDGAKKGTLEFFESRMKMMSSTHCKFPNLQAVPDSWNSVIFEKNHSVVIKESKEEEWKTYFPWKRRNLLRYHQERFCEVCSVVLKTFFVPINGADDFVKFVVLF